MASIAKRALSALLAVWFSVFSVLLPLNASAATFNAASNWSGRAWYVPATGTGMAGGAVVAGIASALARANPWVTALTIGTPIMQYLIEQNGGGNVNVLAGANVKAPTPAGWTDADTPPGSAAVVGQSQAAVSHPSGTYTVPATVRYYGYTIEQSTGPTTWGGYCDAIRAAQGATKGTCTDAAAPAVGGESTCGKVFSTYCSVIYGYAGNTCAAGYTLSGNNCVNTQTVYTCPVGFTLDGQMCTAAGCPSGYELVGGQCSLTDIPKVQWPSDGVPTMVPRVGEGGVYDWWPSDRDPDAPAPATGLHLKNTTLFKDPFGNTIFQQLSPLTTGGVQVSQMMQVPQNSPTAPSMTTIHDVVTGPDGVIQRASQRTVQGDLATVADQAVANQQNAITFPDDYNRELTQQKILTGNDAPAPADWSATVTQKQQEIEDAIKQKIEELPDQYSGDKSKWFSWVWTPPVGECTPFTGTIHTKSVSWNICPYIEKVRDVIGWLFAIFGTWMVYNEMFRRED